MIATEKGWNLYVGGNGGATPKHAQLLAGDLDSDTLVRYIDRYLMFYIRTADRLQRTAVWQETIEGGLDHIRDVVCADALGIAADLDDAMARHIEGYSDEWAGVLNDQEKTGPFRVVRQCPPRRVGPDGRVRRKWPPPQGAATAGHARQRQRGRKPNVTAAKHDPPSIKVLGGFKP